MKLCEAIADFLLGNDFKVITHVPGYGGTEIFNELSKKIPLKISYNEEVAYSIGHGAAVASSRSSVIIKSHGLTKALNTIFDSLYTDITHGMLVFVSHDKTGTHSDNIMDTENFVKSFPLKYAFLDKDNISVQLESSLKRSEDEKAPVFIIFDSDEINSECSFTLKQIPNNCRYSKEIKSTVVHPFLADYQYKKYRNKYYGEDNSLDNINLPTIPNSINEKLKPAALLYAPFFEVLNKIEKDFVTGDTTLSSSYAFPPFNSIDLITYIGGSIPLAIGAYLGGCKNVWALSGDFGFLSAGLMGLNEAYMRNIPIKIVIFYNKQASATGGQPIDKDLLEKTLLPFDKFIVRVENPSNKSEIEKVLLNLPSDKLSIILLEY